MLRPQAVLRWHLLVMRRGRVLGYDQGRPAEPLAAEVGLRASRPARFNSPALPFVITAG